MIRAALPSDAAALLSLEKQVLAEGRWFVAEMDEFKEGLGERSDRLRSISQRPGMGWWVAQEGPRLLGQLRIEPARLRRQSHVGHLEILIAETARNQGLGRALLERAITETRAAGHLKKIALSVFADNTRALHLYQKMGFMEEGRRLREYSRIDGTWADDVLMALWL